MFGIERVFLRSLWQITLDNNKATKSFMETDKHISGPVYLMENLLSQQSFKELPLLSRAIQHSMCKPLNHIAKENNKTLKDIFDLYVVGLKNKSVRNDSLLVQSWIKRLNKMKSQTEFTNPNSSNNPYVGLLNYYSPLLKKILEKNKMTTVGDIKQKLELALRTAAFNGCLEDLETILNTFKFININSQGKDSKKTALHFAVKRGIEEKDPIKQKVYKDCVQCLLKNGANKDIRDSKNQSTVDYDTQNWMQAIFAELQIRNKNTNS